MSRERLPNEQLKANRVARHQLVLLAVPVSGAGRLDLVPRKLRGHEANADQRLSESKHFLHLFTHDGQSFDVAAADFRSGPACEADVIQCFAHVGPW